MTSSTSLEWKKKYELGIDDIDFQHHFFLNLINRLSNELLSPDSRSHRASLIAELNAYARFHFISEENMMRRAGYPALDEHKKHHLELTDQLSRKESMLHITDSEKEAVAVVDFLVDWFINHTVYEDRLFAKYFHDQVD